MTTTRPAVRGRPARTAALEQPTSSREPHATTEAHIDANIESRVARASPDIDPFDRMLLTADGTVTTLLEACTGEPIMTRTTRETDRRCLTDCWALPMAGGDSPTPGCSSPHRPRP